MFVAFSIIQNPKHNILKTSATDKHNKITNFKKVFICALLEASGSWTIETYV